MAVNAFKSQDLVKKSIEFAWAAQDGALDKIDWRSEEFKPADNIGDKRTLRRPGQVSISTPSMGVDYSLSGVTTPPAGFQTLSDPYLTLSIDKRYEANIQLSLEDMLTKVDKSQVMERHIKPALATLRAKAEQDLIQTIELSSGQYVGTVSGSDQAQWLKNGYDVGAILANRGIDAMDGCALVAPNVVPILGPGQATVFKATNAASDTYRTGKLGGYAGLEWYACPYLNSRTITAASGTVAAVSSNYGNSTVATTPTVWTPTMTITAVSGAVPAVGARLVFKNSTTTINTVHPLTKVDTGNAFVAVVTAVNGLNVTVAESLIASGAYQNATADITGTSTTYHVVNAGTSLKASYAFDKMSIVGASPEVKLGADIAPNAIHFKLGGINAAIVTQTWPGTIQQITKIIAFGGFAVPRPEGVVAMY